jgi:hypothetical protein
MENGKSIDEQFILFQFYLFDEIFHFVMFELELKLLCIIVQFIVDFPEKLYNEFFNHFFYKNSMKLFQASKPYRKRGKKTVKHEQFFILIRFYVLAKQK